MSLNRKQVIAFSLCLSGLVVFDTPQVYGNEGTVLKATNKTKTHLTKTKKKDIASPQKKSPLAAILDQIAELLRRVPKQATTRSTRKGYFCPISPGLLEQGNKIVSDRPFFIWKGDVDTVEIESYLTQKTLLSETVPVGSQFWKYSGVSLQPGETYVWSLKYQGVPQARGVIEIMSALDRSTLIARKQSYTQTFEGHPSLARANYFSKQELWSDKLTALATDMNVSHADAVEDLMQSWPEQHCTPEVG